jgi:hypothetical protein
LPKDGPSGDDDHDREVTAECQPPCEGPGEAVASLGGAAYGDDVRASRAGDPAQGLCYVALGAHEARFDPELVGALGNLTSQLAGDLVPGSLDRGSAQGRGHG